MSPCAIQYRKWGFDILKCTACGLGSTATPAGFDPRGIYDSSYFTGGRRDGYLDYPSSEAILRLEFRRAWQHLLRQGCRRGRLLEIGCAFGYFLLEAPATFECVGLELSSSAAMACRARGLDVGEGMVTREFLEARGPFDAIAMFDVIEHLADPAETMALLRVSLVPGGFLILSTGDWGSMVSRLMGRHWRLMTPPQHLYFFSRRTLGMLLERSGFSVVDCLYPWKVVPLGLAVYQAWRMLGPRAMPSWLSRVGVPVNLFDALRVVARRW